MQVGKGKEEEMFEHMSVYKPVLSFNCEKNTGVLYVKGTKMCFLIRRQDKLMAFNLYISF